MLTVQPIAQDHVTVSASPDPQSILVYSPGLLRLPSGHLIAITDWSGPGVSNLAGRKMTLDSGKDTGRDVCIS